MFVLEPWLNAKRQTRSPTRSPIFHSHVLPILVALWRSAVGTAAQSSSAFTGPRRTLAPRPSIRSSVAFAEVILKKDNFKDSVPRLMGQVTARNVRPWVTPSGGPREAPTRSVRGY